MHEAAAKMHREAVLRLCRRIQSAHGRCLRTRSNVTELLDAITDADAGKRPVMTGEEAAGIARTLRAIARRWRV